MCLPAFLLDVLDVVQNDRTSNRRIMIVPSPWNSREPSHCTCPTLSMHPRRPGNVDTASHMQSDPSSASRSGSIQTWLCVSSGSKLAGTGQRCSLRLPPRALFRAASTNIILRCMQRRRSRRSPHCRSEFARTHASSTWPFSLHRGAWCPNSALSRVWWLHRCVARL